MPKINGTSSRKILRWGVSFGVTVVLLYFVFSSIELDQVITVLSKASIQFIFAGLGLYFCVFLVQARMWKVLLEIFDIYSDFWQLLSLYFITLSAGFFLPSTVGSYVPVLYLRKPGQPVGKLVFATSLNIMFQIIPAVFFSAVAVFMLPPLSIFRPMVSMVLLILVGLGGILFLLYLRRQDIAEKLKSLRDKLLFKWVKSEYVEVDQFYIDLHRLINWRMLLVIILAFAATLVGCIAFYLLALAVDTSLSLWSIIVSLSMVTLVTMLPISIGGIGLREGTLLFLFTLLGETSEKAVVLSLLLLMNITFWRLVGIPLWLKFPLPSVKKP